MLITPLTLHAMTVTDSLLLYVLKHLAREQEWMKEKKEKMHLTKKGMSITITVLHSLHSANTLTKSTAFKELIKSYSNCMQFMGKVSQYCKHILLDPELKDFVIKGHWVCCLFHYFLHTQSNCICVLTSISITQGSSHHQTHRSTDQDSERWEDRQGHWSPQGTTHCRARGEAEGPGKREGKGEGKRETPINRFFKWAIHAHSWPQWHKNWCDESLQGRRQELNLLLHTENQHLRHCPLRHLAGLFHSPLGSGQTEPHDGIHKPQSLW